MRAAEVVIVNRYELEALPETPRLTALTLGEEGAVLLEDGAEVARAEAPRVEAVDGTAAGDAFTACLVVSRLEGREWGEALRRACAAGALAASRPVRSPRCPRPPRSMRCSYAVMATPILLDCDPGHDDAIALLLALASPEVELLGVTTVAGNQTFEKTTDNAIRVLELVGRGDVPVALGSQRPLVRERVRRRVRPRRDRARRPGPATAAGGSGGRARGRLPRRARSTAPTLVATGPLTNVALLLARHPGREAPNGSC